MKLSISVPDTLWVEAQHKSKNLGGSELVQVALREYVQAGTAQAITPRDIDPLLPDLISYVHNDEATRAHLLRASEAVKHLVQNRFAEGYRVALAEASNWEADVIRSLLHDWSPLRDRQPPKVIYEVLHSDPEAPAIGEDAGDWREWGAQNSTFMLGYRQGLQDLWETVSASTTQVQPETSVEQLELQSELEALKLEQRERVANGRRFAMSVAIELDIDTIDEIIQGNREPTDIPPINSMKYQDEWSDHDKGPWFWEGFMAGLRMARTELQPAGAANHATDHDDVIDPDDLPFE